MAKRKYFDEHIEYLREISDGGYNDEITKMFNEKFNMNITESAINSLKTKHKIKSNVSKGKTHYTTEQLDYLRELCKVEYITSEEIKDKFNEKFNLNKTESAIGQLRGKHGIYIENPVTGYFRKGQEPWNKGRKGLIGPNRTSFKKGNFSYNRVPVGSERKTKDNYIQIKIQDGKLQQNWRGKHILIWEKENGPLPDGKAIIFGDGDKRNFDLDNLICVSRNQLLRLNQNNLIQDDVELTKVGIKIADLHIKMAERKKGD